MYTHADQMKAVKLYLKYNRSSASVRRELGYPSKGALKQWVDEFETTGSLHVGYRVRPPRYSGQQKQAAVDHYLQHGRNLQRTVNALGYPSRHTLDQWLDEAVPDRRKRRTGRAGQNKVKLTRRQKEQAVKDLCLRDGPACEVAGKHGVTREALYKWRSDLLGKEPLVSKARRDKPRRDPSKTGLEAKVKELHQEVRALEDEVYRLRLERDILEAAAEVLKKGQGADLKQLTNREKAVVVGALREKYHLNELLHGLALSKSSYFYQCAALSAEDKYADLRERVLIAFARAHGRYGYRRIHAVITRDGKTVSEKVVRRLLREENLVVAAVRRRKYSSYKGEITPAVPNVIDRDFHADAPNMKWLTDLTEFALPAGKVYLSPIIDCFDGLAVSWSIGTSPDAALVNTMLDEA
ncbi:MAG: IS3 family transposase, partial [Chitinophagales bacterium]